MSPWILKRYNYFKRKRMQKSMSKSSKLLKQRWNTDNYTQIKISIAPKLATSFKNACLKSKVSTTSKLSEFMIKYLKFSTEKGENSDYKTKRQRRNAVKSIVENLEIIKCAEEQCKDNIPENLQNSANFETAEECVSSLEEAIDILNAIY